MDDSEKAKADLYYKLAERATARFCFRRNTDWKIDFALWTMFGAGAVVVLSTGAWRPQWYDAVIGTILAIAIVLLYGFCWLPFRAAAFRREQLVAYWWETNVERLLGDGERPKYLKPEGDFRSAFDKDPNEVKGDPEGKPWKSSRKLRKGQWLVLTITSLLALLFIGALWSRYLHEPVPPQNSGQRKADTGPRGPGSS